MKRTLYLLIVSILMTSCATIFNEPHKNIIIYTTEPSKIIHNQDTTQRKRTRTRLEVERKNEKLTITSASDRLTKTIEVQPIYSKMYWYNILGNYGVGMFIDKKSPKSYAYPTRIYINSGDTISRFFKHSQSNHKGAFDLHLSLPHINSFRLQPVNEGSKVNTGFWGLTAGIDYYHSSHQFLNLGVTGVMDFFVPVPAAVRIEGQWERMSSTYIGLSNNHRIKRFSLGYGVSYGKNTWDLISSNISEKSDSSRDPIEKSNYSLGLIFPAYFRLGHSFNFGAVYRPTFYQINPTRMFLYEHLISIDLAWKIRLKK